MKKLILFSIIFSFFTIFNVAYAIPFVAIAIPYMFNIWIFFIGIIFSFFLFLLKKYKIFGFIFVSLSIFSFLILLIILGVKQIQNIILPFGKYVYILFTALLSSIFIILYNLNIIKNKKISLCLYILGNLILVFFLLINFNLLRDLYNLNNNFTELTNDFNTKVNNTLKFTTYLKLNHIFISRDFKYIYEGNTYECRLTLSYYDKNSKKKLSKINMYVGLRDNTQCRNIFEK